MQDLISNEIEQALDRSIVRCVLNGVHDNTKNSIRTQLEATDQLTDMKINFTKEEFHSCESHEIIYNVTFRTNCNNPRMYGLAEILPRATLAKLFNMANNRYQKYFRYKEASYGAINAYKALIQNNNKGR